MNSTDFDSNYDASLTLSCLQGGGVMELTSASFDGMDIYMNVEITNCEIPVLPSRAFSNFGEVNYFGIQGGKMSAVQGNAFTGFTVRRNPNSVNPRGKCSLDPCCNEFFNCLGNPEGLTSVWEPDLDCRNALPLTAVDFSPPPQRLTVTYVYGQFDGLQFTNFSSVNTSFFDSNYDATLTLICGATGGGGGLLTFHNTSFEGMDFYKNVLIQNCEIEHLIASTFVNLVSLNFLGFQGGYMNVINRQSMNGLDISPDPTAITPLGELSFDDVDLIPGGIPNGVMDPLQNLAILTAKHCRISGILTDTFKNLKKVHTLTLDDNMFSYIPKEAFRNMTALSRVSLKAIPWQCTCNNLWFVDDFEDNGIEMISEVVCDMPGIWTESSSALRDVGGKVAIEPALRSEGNLLSRVQALPPALWPDEGLESLRSACCRLAMYNQPIFYSVFAVPHVPHSNCKSDIAFEMKMRTFVSVSIFFPVQIFCSICSCLAYSSFIAFVSFIIAIHYATQIGERNGISYWVSSHYDWCISSDVDPHYLGLLLANSETHPYITPVSTFQHIKTVAIML
ncbi:ubx domain-containing protein 10-like [Plakobranchus ocellatus]|uniref:Ubx domain-containing protein 10-like n=1 Tax=Plakobranchus ocellatus TaxID=259542 RepID=A0AAV4AMX6_9GAST|nr:ubx domain-containing protein 10-like [Plakobranchus ocellatus]